MLALLNPQGFVKSSGYLAIFVLSVLQSCCVPTSSELTLGFGGVLAAEGDLSLPGVIAVGAAGEIVGAYIAWVIGRVGGRAFVDRYGKYVLLSHRDLDRAEGWYERHSRWGVFGSRLLPVIRNFVALPAGVAEVPLVRFGLLTAAGSVIWDAAMALIGYEVGGRWKTVMHGFSYAGYLLGALAVAALAVLIVHRYRSYKAATADQDPQGYSGDGRHFEGAAAPTLDARTVGDASGSPSTHEAVPAGQVAPAPRAVPTAEAVAASEAVPSPEGSPRLQP